MLALRLRRMEKLAGNFSVMDGAGEKIEVFDPLMAKWKEVAETTGYRRSFRSSNIKSVQKTTFAA